MRSNLPEPKKITQKQTVNSYLSSYTDKYKRKGGKSSFDLDKDISEQNKSSRLN